MVTGTELRSAIQVILLVVFAAIIITAPTVIAAFSSVSWDFDAFWDESAAYAIVGDELNAETEFREPASLGLRLENERFFRGASNFAEKLPDAVSVGVRGDFVPRNLSTSRSVISQTISTDPVTGSSRTKPAVYVITALQFLSFAFFALLLFGFPNWEPSNIGITFVAFFGTGVAGVVTLFFLFMVFALRSTIHIDNATENSVSVFVDDVRIIDLQPRTRAEFIMTAGTWDFRAESGSGADKEIELSKLRIHMFGPNSFIYNIEGANSYSRQTATYRRTTP